MFEPKTVKSVDDSILQLLSYIKKNNFRDTSKNFNIKRTRELDIK